MKQYDTLPSFSCNQIDHEVFHDILGQMALYKNTLSVLMWPKTHTSWISVDVALFRSMVPVYSLGYFYTQKGKWRLQAIININHVEKKPQTLP